MGQNLVINGVTYNEVPEIRVPKAGGGTASYMDVTPSDVTAAEVLAGKKYVNQYGTNTGTMANVGMQTGNIAARDTTVQIQQGYHNGNGSVGIDPTEKSKLVSSNIRAGVTILGVNGSSAIIDTSIDANPATPATILNGRQAYVNGQLVTGTMDTPAISQDSATGILTVQ